MQCYFTALRNYGDNAAGVEGARPGEDKRIMERTHIALGRQLRSFAAGTGGLSLYQMCVFSERNVYCVKTKRSGSYPGRDTPAPGFTDLSAD